MNTYGQWFTGPAGMPPTREMREGGEQQTFRAQEEQTESFIPQAEPAPVQPTTTGNYFTPDEARTRFAQHLPIQATPNDVLLPSDDPRVYTYQMPNGDIYYLPAFEEQLTERRSVGQVIDLAMDSIPSRTEVESAIVGAPQAAYNSIRNMVTGQGTYEDIIGTAAGMVGTNAIPRSSFTDEILSDTPADGPNDYWDGVDENAVDTDFEPIGDDDFGQWDPEPVPQPPMNPLTPEQITGPVPEQGNWLVPPSPLREGKKPGTGTSPLYPPRDYTTDYAIPDTIVFRSPIRDIVAGLQVPSQGIKGSQFIKMLQDNPSVRNSEVSALDLGINPQARYTREELDQLVNSRVPQVEGYLTRQFESYQRQKVQDPELGYDELVIEATPQQGRGFRANNQHYSDNTLAHTRLSTREGENGPYVLVEEMQSDLIQQGWLEPTKQPQNFTDWQLQQYPVQYEHQLELDDLEVFNKVISRLPIEIFDGNTPYSELASQVRTNFENGEYIAPNQLKNLIEDYTDFISTKNSGTLSTIGVPPIRNTQESTRLLVEGLISYADQRGVNEIVFPPLERIAAERFRPGTKYYNKAITPGSGFHQTYVASLKKVLQELQTEFGRENIPIYRRELPYETRTNAVSVNYDQVAADYALIRRQQELVDNGDAVPVDADGNELDLNPISDDENNRLRSLYGDNYQFAQGTDELFEMNSEMVSSKLPVDGVAIDISALREQYNLQYPRFAEGGLVTQTKQAFGGMT